MKKKLKELGKCLLNLDVCKNVDDTLEAFLDYMNDVRLDKTGLKLWVKKNPVENGAKLATLLWAKLEKKWELDNVYDLFDNVSYNVLALKNKKNDMVKKLKCLRYDNLQNLDFWKEYLSFTSTISEEELEDVASDLMIYASFVSNKTSKLLMDFLKNLEVEDDFINHIKRYSDVIRYHRGLFVKTLENMTEINSKEEALKLTENIIKYSHCNIPISSDYEPLTINVIVSYILGNEIKDILPYIVKSLTWKLNCTGKEIGSDNVEFNDRVREFVSNNPSAMVDMSDNNIDSNGMRKSNRTSRKSDRTIVNIPEVFTDDYDSTQKPPEDLLETEQSKQQFEDVNKRISDSLGSSFRESTRPIVVSNPVIPDDDGINLDKLEQELKSN